MRCTRKRGGNLCLIARETGLFELGALIFFPSHRGLRSCVFFFGARCLLFSQVRVTNDFIVPFFVTIIVVGFVPRSFSFLFLVVVLMTR